MTYYWYLHYSLLHKHFIIVIYYCCHTLLLFIVIVLTLCVILIFILRYSWPFITTSMMMLLLCEYWYCVLYITCIPVFWPDITYLLHSPDVDVTVTWRGYSITVLFLFGVLFIVAIRCWYSSITVVFVIIIIIVILRHDVCVDVVCVPVFDGDGVTIFTDVLILHLLLVTLWYGWHCYLLLLLNDDRYYLLLLLWLLWPVMRVLFCCGIYYIIDIWHYNLLMIFVLTVSLFIY